METQKTKTNLWPVDELERFFKDAKIPPGPVKLDQCTTIVDVQKFIRSHLSAVRKNNGNVIFLPYFERLVQFKEIINLKRHE